MASEFTTSPSPEEEAKKGSPMNEKEELQREIDELEERLRDRELALPAHSIRPSQLLIIEELEEKIKEKKRLLTAVQRSRGI